VPTPLSVCHSLTVSLTWFHWFHSLTHCMSCHVMSCPRQVDDELEKQELARLQDMSNSMTSGDVEPSSDESSESSERCVCGVLHW
jgi:hypothetical protein